MRAIFPALASSPNGADVTVRGTRRYADTPGGATTISIIVTQKLRPPKLERRKCTYSDTASAKKDDV